MSAVKVLTQFALILQMRGSTTSQQKLTFSSALTFSSSRQCIFPQRAAHVPLSPFRFLDHRHSLLHRRCTFESQESHFSYSTSPLVHATSLAHLLWSSVIRKNDTVIDATCGNGHDSLELAKLLFTKTAKDGDRAGWLICMDVQKSATHNTRDRLSNFITGTGLEVPIFMDGDAKDVSSMSLSNSRVTIIQGSHDKYFPRSLEDVGLVVYNLGFLPGSIKNINTCTASTLSSISSASTTLRIGGALSIITYPGSNLAEDVCVRVFCEALSYISSLEGLTDERVKKKIADVGIANSEDLKTIWEAVKKVMEKNEKKGWRVYEHQPVGRSTSPTLITAIRIK